MEPNEFDVLRNAISETKHSAEINRQRDLAEEGEYKWKVYDSGLLSGETSYQKEFGSLCPEGYANIREYIESYLAEKKGHCIGLEIGGPGSKLFSEFSPGFFEQTYGCTLSDKRDDEQKSIDARNNHNLVPADIFSSIGRRSLAKSMGGRKADLIFERMKGGLELIPDDPILWKAVLNQWYEMLNEEGIIFLETPEIDDLNQGKKSGEWIYNIKSGKVPGLWANFNISIREEEPYGIKPKFFVLIQKGKGAPESIKDIDFGS